MAWELPLTYPKLCCKEIRILPKIRVLPSGTLPQSLDLGNFCHGRLIVWSTKLVMVEPVDYTYDSQGIVVGFTLLFITHWSTVTV